MYDGMKVIDVHGHMSTPVGFRGGLANMVSQNTPAKVEIPDEQMENAQQRHLRVMDERNIDYQLISPRPIAMWHWMRPFLQEAWCESTNLAIAQIMRLHPDRFGGIAQLPQSRDIPTHHCAGVLEYCVKELGFVGGLINPDPGADRLTPGVHDEYWYPLYERAEKLGASLMIHPSKNNDPRWEIVPANYQLNNVVEEFVAMQLYEHGKVFDDFPKLKIFICHGGGALHRFIATDHHRGQKDLSKNLYFDSCVLDIPMLKATIEQKGADRIVFGTEAPGSGGAIRPETGRPGDDLVPVIDAIDFLTREDKVKIFNTNAKEAVPLLKAD